VTVTINGSSINGYPFMTYQINNDVMRFVYALQIPYDGAISFFLMSCDANTPALLEHCRSEFTMQAATGCNCYNPDGYTLLDCGGTVTLEPVFS
jgi:hypothetical protein